MTMRTVHRRIARLLALAGTVLLLLTGCGGTEDITPDPSASDFGTVRIGRGTSAETGVIAEIYARTLRDAGYTVEVVDDGTRQEYLSAMAEGGDQAPLITPDYTGALLLHLTDDGARNPSVTEAPTPSVSAAASGAASASGGPTPTPTGLNVQGMSPGDISATVDRVLSRQLSTLDAASAENRDALVVTRATAAKYDLSSISDLAAHCGQLRFGTPSGFADRSYGTAGLRRLYECTPGRYVEQSDPARLVDELADGTVDVADIPTASAAIGQNGFVVLEDPQADFIAQQVVPVVRADTLPSSAVDALNTVSGKLSTSDLTFLDQLMSGPDAVSAQDAAAFWVQEGTD
ncbi:ABC transporter substrate-binding protein [Rothia kristinae]|uniref:ABC transporter substrate-binding protein n=1 Tax=Rothia kristinae TaxID=37923 RepID=A0A7T4T4E4_9MICC|nr:ABC transporter substrate-binding protein [Rothia kristinae]QQC59180.1 ABC transporter substrate-binding protein [Rothia kristinae]